MAASSANLNIEQGSTFGATVTIKNADLTAFNLTGYSIRGQIRNRYSSSSVLLDLAPVIQTGSGNSLLVSGLVDIDLTAAQTAALPITHAVYDIEIFDVSGTVTKVLAGKAIINPEVTR